MRPSPWVRGSLSILPNHIFGSASNLRFIVWKLNAKPPNNLKRLIETHNDVDPGDGVESEDDYGPPRYNFDFDAWLSFDV